VFRRKPHLAALLLPVLAAAGCQASVSVGGLDYEKLEREIATALNESYKAFSREVSEVDCPRQAETPGPGDTFICTATFDGNPVRALVTVKDADHNVHFKTMDNVYDLPGTADNLTSAISEGLGFPVTISCGEGLKVVEIGQSFECTATDEDGDTRTVKVTANPAGESDDWEVLEEG
jgi:Domain of unknown function (DUF4333)